MNQKFIYSIVIALVALLVSCDDTLDQSLARYTPTINISMPAGMEQATVVSEKWQVKDVSTGRTTTFADRRDITLKAGLYDLLRKGGAATLHRMYLQHLYRRQGLHRYADRDGEFLAEVHAVEPSGHLLLRRPDGHVSRYEFKEVKFLNT